MRSGSALALGAALALAAVAVAGGVAAWRLQAMGAFDLEPPELAVTVPSGSLRGTVPLEVAVTDAFPGVGRVVLRVDDVEIATGPPWTIDTATLPDGAHVVRVDAADLAGNAVAATAAIATDNTPPVLTLAARSRVAHQGSPHAVAVRSDEPLTAIEARFLDQPRPLYLVADHTWRALIGIGVRQEPGAHPLVVIATDAAGNRAELRADIAIEAVDWPYAGTLRLTRAQTADSRDTEAVAKMRAERDGAYATIDPVQRWGGAMRTPVAGVRTSAYGQYRARPDGSRSHHDAVDLSNRPGTPVYAANDGVVLVARRQAVLGNAVILGHGQAVTTSYNHLQRIEVTEGQNVRRGDLVGLLGTTGQSTGPHLHWGMVVDRVAVDAQAWPADGFDPARLGPFD